MIKIQIIKKEDKNYPQKLLQIQNPPKQLYVEGDSNLLFGDILAIVGNRNASDYGKKYTAIFAKEISKQKITIISGLAIGIDTIAHINSMEQVGKTIAVLGSGFDNIFPEENLYLYKKILENGGCIVSEYPPETVKSRENFPKRNRIISGLSMGVLLVEAKSNSGGLITARLAIKQQKDLFCIPNKLGESLGAGTNMLIKQGANLVTTPEDILDFYNIEENNEQTPIDEEYKEIYNLIGEMPISTNEISKLTKRPIEKVIEITTMLELQGLIKSIPGNKYIKN